MLGVIEEHCKQKPFEIGDLIICQLDPSIIYKIEDTKLVHLENGQTVLLAVSLHGTRFPEAKSLLLDDNQKVIIVKEEHCRFYKPDETVLPEIKVHDYGADGFTVSINHTKDFALTSVVSKSLTSKDVELRINFSPNK